LRLIQGELINGESLETKISAFALWSFEEVFFRRESFHAFQRGLQNDQPDGDMLEEWLLRDFFWKCTLVTCWTDCQKCILCCQHGALNSNTHVFCLLIALLNKQHAENILETCANFLIVQFTLFPNKFFITSEISTVKWLACHVSLECHEASWRARKTCRQKWTVTSRWVQHDNQSHTRWLLKLQTVCEMNSQTWRIVSKAFKGMLAPLEIVTIFWTHSGKLEQLWNAVIWALNCFPSAVQVIVQVLHVRPHFAQLHHTTLCCVINGTSPLMMFVFSRQECR